MEWVRRLRSTILGSKVSAEFDEEIRFHFARHVEDFVKSGMAHEQATREASRRLGSRTLARDQTRDADTLHWLADFGQDLRHAGRALRKSPAFAVVAMLTLGLGVGLNTAIFIFADALIFRPPDVPRPSELVRIFSRTNEVPFGKISYPDYLDFRSQITTLSGTVAYDSRALPVSRNRDDVRQLLGALVVSGNYFSVLGVEPTVGRGFRDADDRPGASAVVVISHKLWERTFQSNPAAIGQEISVAKRTFTVIGVAPPGFATTESIAFHPDVYIPIAMVNDVVSSLPANLREDRSTAWLTVVGRLVPGATPSTASAEITILARSLEQRTQTRTISGRRSFCKK